MCCVVSFWGPVLYKTENNTSYKATSQQTRQWNDYQQWSQAVPAPASPSELWISKTRNGDCTLSDIAVFFFFCSFCLFIIDPFPLTLWSSGGGGVGSLCAWFELTVHLNESLKCSSGLQLFSISNRSNEQQYGLYLLFLFNYVLYFLPFFFSFFLFLFSTGWWLAKPRGGSSFFFSRHGGVPLTYFWIFQHTGDAGSATDRTWR